MSAKPEDRVSTLVVLDPLIRRLTGNDGTVRLSIMSSAVTFQVTWLLTRGVGGELDTASTTFARWTGAIIKIEE